MSGLLTRRSFAGALLAARAFRGVTLGVHTYSFRDRPFEAAVAAMAKLGVAECDVGGIHFEPPRTRPLPKDYREKVRQWRLSASMDVFERAARLLREAGIHASVYTHNFTGGPDAELERGFEMAKALGAGALAMSTRVSLAPQIHAVARKHRMRVGLHNHSRLAPDQMATPDDFAAALKGRSDYLAITLDIGHFVAAGFDPLRFLEERHDDVLSLHLKDRKKNQGATVPFGEGDVPLAGLLRRVRDNRYNILCHIEYEYEGGDTVEEVGRCFEYCKRALLA